MRRRRDVARGTYIEEEEEAPVFSDISVKQGDKGNREDTRHEEHYGYVQRCAVKGDRREVDDRDR